MNKDGVEKKIMNNNPKVASVNLVNDIIGDSDKGLGFKVVVGVLTFCLAVIGIALIVIGYVFTGLVLIFIGALLVFTSTKKKFKRKKYQVDEKKVKEIEPLFKD